MSCINTFYERGLNYIYNHFGQHLSDRNLIRLRFRIIFHRNIDLEHPETFYEKIQWLKLNDRKPIYHIMADKYLVREFVKERLGDGEDYLIPLLGVYDTAEDIDFDTLPEQFVLKCTHDSQSIVICRDRAQLNEADTRRRLHEALHTDYSLYGREWAYQGLKPRIVAEELISDESGYDLKDYKIFCFDGEPRFIELDYDRFIHHKRRIYTADWEELPVKITYEDDKSIEFPRPKQLGEMLDISRKLSAGMAFLRVDLYSTPKQVYFGEITFYPGNGFEPIEPDYWDQEWGKLIHLPEKDV